MNLWESVHRGLDKATKEAARIAKTQKLRATIDGLSRQISAQNTTLINTTMELFMSNGLQESELLTICQEIARLRDQLSQAQNELQQLHQGQITAPPPPLSGMPPTGADLPSTPIPPTIPAFPGPGYGETAPPPPDFQTFAVSQTMPPPPPGIPAGSSETASQAPPPPPGITQISAINTVIQPPAPETRRCPACQTEIALNTPFCPQCGSFVQTSGAEQLPTMRGSSTIDNLDTIRAEPVAPPSAPQERITGPGAAQPDSQDADKKGEGA